MNNGFPWRDEREKDFVSMQVFIESLTILGAVVPMLMHPHVFAIIVSNHINLVSTNFVMEALLMVVNHCGCQGLLFMFVTCKHRGRHFVATERDYAIFNAILVPLCNVIPLATRASVPHNINFADDDVHVWKVAKCSCVNK